MASLEALRAETGASARFANRLAVALRPEHSRECLLSRVALLAVLTFDFLQGAFEKIHLQRLLCKQALQIGNLSPAPGFPGLLGWLLFPDLGSLTLFVPPM